ncbi:hypothetical protein LINPERPRIM_LOCUS8452 [Linum perenne]
MTSYAMERRSSPKHPLLKNTTPSSPHPTSPMLLKSPMPKSPAHHETYKSRCAHCLLGFFRFRQTTHSKKLISDSRTANKHCADDGLARNKLDWLPSVDGKCDCIDTEQDDPRTSTASSGHKEVLKLQVEDVKSDSKVVASRTKRHKKRRRVRRLPISGCYDVATMGLGKRVPERLIGRSSKEEESVVSGPNQDRSDRNRPKEINFQFHMNEAAEAFINQRLVDGQLLGEDEGKVQSKHFLDALDVLNSNRDLFSKLLQDPNSLLVKHIEDLRDSQQKVLGLVNEHLETIVVLKPDVKGLEDHADVHNNDSSVGQHSLRGVQQGVRPALSPFGQMKRKLMKALGPHRKPQLPIQADCPERKATQGMDECNEGTGMQIAETNLLEQTSSAEVQANDKANRLRKFVRDARKESVSTSPTNNKTSTIILLKKQRTKTWDGICSIDELDSLTVGTRGKRELGFVTPQMRISPHSHSQMAQESKWRDQRGMGSSCVSPQRQTMDASPQSDANRRFEMLEAQPSIPDGVSADEGNDGASTGSYIHLHSKANAISEVQTNLNFEDTSTYRIVAEPNGIDSSEVHEFIDTPRAFDCLRPDSSIENQASMYSEADYMSSPPHDNRIEVLGKMEDIPEQPSPVSVLERYCTEEITSPISNKSHSDFTIDTSFEEKWTATVQYQAQYTDACLEEYRSLSDSIVSILHAGISSWDELLLRCHWSDEFLLENVLDEVDIYLCNDRILFEYVNEILLEAYHHCLKLSPWLSSMKSKIRPVSVAEHTTQEVMKCIDWNLLLQPPMQTLEEFVKRDLSHSSTWTHNKGEADEIVSDAAESIMQDLIMDLVQL